MAATRSGSGKIVFEHFDKSTQIWGGSASRETLCFGTDADSFSEEQESSSKSATSSASSSSSSPPSSS